MAQERPVHEVRLGKVKAAIWRNETEVGVRYGVTFSAFTKATIDGNPVCLSVVMNFRW